MNKIIVGSDHGGFEYKAIISEHLSNKGYEVIDVGTHDNSSVDYPDIAKLLAEKVLANECLGILVCGTGIGISIAANKCKGIRAAVCNDVYSAKMAKEHNNSNVLALGQRVVGEGQMLMIVDTWLNTEFAGGRHERRVNKIENLEE